MKQKTLGETLKECRSLMGLTLKQIEESAGVSNAYLSQLENDKIKKPSANILYKLATIYNVDIEVFLIACGLVKKEDRHTHNLSVLGMAASKLTTEEEEALLEFLKFLRFSRKEQETRGII